MKTSDVSLITSLSCSEGGIETFGSLNLDKLYRGGPIDAIVPITLSEDWLTVFKFIKWGESRYGNKYILGVSDWGFTIENSFDEDKWFFGHEYYDAPNEDENNKSMHFCYDLKYVHQLQNIYFALVLNELKFNYNELVKLIQKETKI